MVSHWMQRESFSLRSIAALDAYISVSSRSMSDVSNGGNARFFSSFPPTPSFCCCEEDDDDEEEEEEDRVPDGTSACCEYG
jgi:hypothetical protein